MFWFSKTFTQRLQVELDLSRYEFNKYIFHAWFRGLYDEGMRSVLARHPNKGYTSCTSWNIRMPFAALGLPLCIGRRFLMGSMQPHESSVQ